MMPSTEELLQSKFMCLKKIKTFQKMDFLLIILKSWWDQVLMHMKKEKLLSKHGGLFTYFSNSHYIWCHHLASNEQLTVEELDYIERKKKKLMVIFGIVW